MAVTEEEKLFGLTEEQQLTLIEFDKRNFYLIGDPTMNVTKAFLRKNDYSLGPNTKITNKELIKMIAEEKPNSIYNNRQNIEATVNELFEMNPNIGNNLRLIEFTKDPLLLDYLCDDALRYVFDKYAKQAVVYTNYTITNVFYAITPEFINEKCSDRVKTLYKQWIMEEKLKRK